VLSRSTTYEPRYVKWDVDNLDMVFEEPEAESCLQSRSSPHRAARPVRDSQRLPPSLTVAQALVLPLALLVVQGTVVEAKEKLGAPRAAAAPSLVAIAPTAPEPSIVYM
jgi:hypothetical protein